MANKTYTTDTNKTISIPETIEDSKGNTLQVEQKTWEKEGKKRVYISVLFARSGKVNCGYVDLVTGAIGLKSSPAWIAQEVKANIA
jgi:hypothetical protein